MVESDPKSPCLPVKIVCIGRRIGESGHIIDGRGSGLIEDGAS
jgi:hypothetical protein